MKPLHCGLAVIAAAFGSYRTCPAGEVWYALAENQEAPPYGYQHFSGDTPSIYKGRRARRVTLNMVYKVEALGQSVDGSNSREYYIEPGGGLMAFTVKRAAGEECIISEGEFRRDGLYVRRYKEGSPPEEPAKITPPENVMFAVGPSFLWPVVKDSDGAVSVSLFDESTFGVMSAVAVPGGSAAVNTGGRRTQARRYTVDIFGAEGGARGKQVLYFDPSNGTLVLSETIGPGGSVESVMYQTDAGVARRIVPRRIRPDVLPAREFRYVPFEPSLYVASIKEGELGRGYFMLKPQASVGRYEIEEGLRLVGPQEERRNTSTLYLDQDLTLVRYNSEGKVTDPTGDVVNVSYNRSAQRGARFLTWTGWAKDVVSGKPGASKQGQYRLDDRVFLLDNNLVSGFAALASQVPLYPGQTFTVGVFHSGLQKLGMMNIAVREKVSVQDEQWYAVDFSGFCGRYLMYIDENNRLRRAVLVMGAQGERDITYDIVR